jgi:sugar lactone lactonase YvrE
MLLFLLAALPFLTGLNSPDGLSADGDGICICEENAGRVLYALFDGTVTVIAEELSSPEGICVTGSGRVFVVEDAEHGRLVELVDDSVVTMVSDLCCPEGVTVDRSGDIWFTTGGIQGGCLFTSLWKMSGAEVTVEYSLPSAFSFSDVEAADDGMIYVCSESSGLFGNVAVFRFNPASGELLPFVTGVSSCEGICTTAGDFPFYITDESGSVYTVDTDGTPVLFQDGLETIEDVVVVNDRLFVSEDGTGSVLALKAHE